MILMHKSLKRSDDIMRSLRRFFEINFKTIDGVLEVFNNNTGQGYLLKVFQSYNKSNDLAIWMFQSIENKNIQIAYSTHSNINEHNNWINKNNVNFKIYPIKIDIKKTIIRDICDTLKNYYSLNEEIEIPKRISI